jgi:hypothetical protein
VKNHPLRLPKIAITSVKAAPPAEVPAENPAQHDLAMLTCGFGAMQLAAFGQAFKEPYFGSLFSGLNPIFPGWF